MERNRQRAVCSTIEVTMPLLRQVFAKRKSLGDMKKIFGETIVKEQRFTKDSYFITFNSYSSIPLNFH